MRGEVEGSGVEGWNRRNKLYNKDLRRRLWAGWSIKITCITPFVINLSNMTLLVTNLAEDKVVWLRIWLRGR
jgi:hypothetical protein